MNRVLVLGCALCLVALSSVQSRAASLVLPRSGQVGIGVLGQYGTLMQAGRLGDEFGAGAGMAVKLKYRMRYERGIGLTFDSQNLDARTPGQAETEFLAIPEAGVTRNRLVLTTASFDLYQFFDTRSRTVKSLSASIGLVQVSARLSNGEVQYPLGGDGLFLGAGAGIERFVYRSWAWDLATRYQAVFHDGKVNHDVQLSLGMIFYAAY